MPWERKEAIEVTLLWAGAKNLPKSAEITRLEMTGSAFSRGFEMEFKSNKSDLEWWILNSKTVEFASEKINKVNATIYVLTPAMEKAQYAKVHINWVTSSVFIRVYWS
jgi:UDP-N-acetylglucosamine enolpyruvyl transferase